MTRIPALLIAAVLADVGIAWAQAPSHNTGDIQSSESPKVPGSAGLATNDRLDRIPTMARGPQLTEAQRKLILDRVLPTPPATREAGAGPTDALPAGVPMQMWPADLVRQIPAIHDTKYVALADKILVVRPESRIVIGEINR